MTHTVTIKDLLKRPIIRKDKAFEWMNKMTDDELVIWYKELEEMRDKDNIDNPFYEFSKEIDTDILYNIFKMKVDEKYRGT